MARKRANELGVAAVAKRAGVSTATVSNTLNRPHMVSPATQARVLAAIEELQFVPNRSASALRSGSGKLIGLIVPDIVNPFYAAIAKAVAHSARTRGYVTGLCVSDDDAEIEMEHIRMLAEQRAAGAIVVPLAADTSRLARLRLVGAHPVLVDRRWPVADGCSVAIDDERGGHLAVEHLLTTRTGRVLVVNGPRDIPQCVERETGARQAIAADGGDSSALEVIEVPEMTIEGGVQAASRIAEDPPAGIFCTNDQLALGVIRGLVGAGVQVPTDVAVVGYGDLALATESMMPLTSVRQPKDVLGRSAVDLLLAEIESAGSHAHEARLLEPSLMVRASAP
ncbi:LacI family DNA-binding transcriptional regulator [Ruania zhangjianzhongii]|uniref:LacI family DNA-binding transcriptional regulator n=1 Tax=Ruania zhangjianzhongii TaxID=2603206 RepID=UPI0011CAA097|nr:substrate-binding domain-containing protein [Ruania zhangjianzhongii]